MRRPEDRGVRLRRLHDDIATKEVDQIIEEHGQTL